MFCHEFLVRLKVGPKSQFSQILAANLKKRYFWSGSAGEAACQGRERVGALKIEEHSLSDLARRTEGGGGSMGYRLFRRPPDLSLCVWVLDYDLWLCVLVHIAADSCR